MHYIKKLQFQELGSPSVDGKVSRGRYFLISKSTNDFFPPLSKTQLNDTIILPIIPPNSVQKVYCSFVYHNDKYHGSLANSPRDEYRLYLNSEIDPNRSYFKVSDIVIFSKYFLELNVPIYKIDIFRVGDEHYEDLNALITSSPINGNHALFEGSLDFIDTQMTNLETLETVIPAETKQIVKKEQDKYNYSEIEETKRSNLFNSVSFRDFVLLGYKNRCAITNESIFHEKLINLEAAHIMPKSHSGSFLPCNGIALSRDMHWAFDKGMFSISEEHTIIVHDDVKNTILNKYHNQKINLPTEDFFKPEKAFLNYHREKIFGLFKHSGVIRSSI